MSRLAVVALVVAPLAAFGELTAPSPPSAAPPEAAQAEEMPQPPETQTAKPEPQPFDLGYTEQEKAVAAKVVDEQVREKIRQVNEAMAEPDEPPTPPVAAVETPAPDTWSPLQNTMRAAFGLLVVLALLFVLAWLAKRFGRNNPLLAGGNLGRVIGKVYLSPRASLHFVRTGDKVLVVGVTANSVSAVAEFDADLFEAAGEEPPQGPGGSPQSETETFLAQFKASLDKIARAAPSETADTTPEQEEAEITGLREDVQRLQRYLQESSQSGDDNP